MIQQNKDRFKKSFISTIPFSSNILERRFPYYFVYSLLGRIVVGIEKFRSGQETYFVAHCFDDFRGA